MTMQGGAIFDVTGNYRYSLWRQWENTAHLVFIMLNPSTADAQTNDATIRRCVGFAQSWGYGSLEVVNLFALRATQPQHLRDAVDPIGSACDHYLLAAAAKAERIVVAWGNWGCLHQRDRSVLMLLAPHTPLHCLGTNQTGQPCHPLYIRRTANLTQYC